MGALNAPVREATEKDLSIFDGRQIQSLKECAKRSGGFIIIPDCLAAGRHGPWKEEQRDLDSGLKISLKLLEQKM